MQKNHLLDRTRIEQEARLILNVALEIAATCVNSPTLRSLPLSSNFSYQFLWEGKEHSETEVRGDKVHIRLAFQDLFGFEKDGLYYYSESTELARKSISSGYVSTRAALCALIAHEVAHVVLFTTQPTYGARPHNKAWLNVTLYLRERLLPVFDFDAERSYSSFMEGEDVLNFEWELLMSYIRNYDSLMNSKPKKLGFRFHFRLVGAIIERLIGSEEQAGLVILSNKLFKPTP